MLFGEYKHTLDSKNRLFIPAKHREVLGPTFVITRNVDKCLSVYSMEEWTRLSEKLHALPEMQARDVVRFIHAKAADVQPDAQGRVIIPSELVAFAGLDKTTYIIGCDNHAEIWSEERWAARNTDEEISRIEGIMLALGF